MSLYNLLAGVPSSSVKLLIVLCIIWKIHKSYLGLKSFIFHSFTTKIELRRHMEHLADAHIHKNSGFDATLPTGGVKCTSFEKIRVNLILEILVALVIDLHAHRLYIPPVKKTLAFGCGLSLLMALFSLHQKRIASLLF